MKVLARVGFKLAYYNIKSSRLAITPLLLIILCRHLDRISNRLLRIILYLKSDHGYSIIYVSLLEKKLDGNYTRMLRAILNKSWRQHTTSHQLYGHLPPITKTIQVRQTRHAGHCWRSRGELIREVLLWTPTYGRAKAGRPVRTYIQQLCEDTVCNPEDLPEAMNDREKWRERVRDIHASGRIWWWWYIVAPAHNSTLADLRWSLFKYKIILSHLGPIVNLLSLMELVSFSLVS